MAPVCPFCQTDSVLVDSAEVYGGKSYGMIWLCRPCGAWVGCHKNSPVHRPLGSLANAGLRKLRTRVHAVLDPLWKAEINSGGKRARNMVYAWLAKQLGVTPDECHVAMFDTEKCVRALEILQDVEWPAIRDAGPIVPPV